MYRNENLTNQQKARKIAQDAYEVICECAHNSPDGKLTNDHHEFLSDNDEFKQFISESLQISEEVMKWKDIKESYDLIFLKTSGNSMNF